MLGLTTSGTTNTNQLKINIPEELIGIELQIIILPAVKNSDQQIEFFTDDELQQLPDMYLGTAFQDDEDYSKW